MKRSRFSEEQVVKILKSAEPGAPVDELLRKHGVSRAPLFPDVTFWTLIGDWSPRKPGRFSPAAAPHTESLPCPDPQQEISASWVTSGRKSVMVQCARESYLYSKAFRRTESTKEATCVTDG